MVKEKAAAKRDRCLKTFNFIIVFIFQLRTRGSDSPFIIFCMLLLVKHFQYNSEYLRILILS